MRKKQKLIKARFSNKTSLCPFPPGSQSPALKTLDTHSVAINQAAVRRTNAFSLGTNFTTAASRIAPVLPAAFITGSAFIVYHIQQTICRSRRSHSDFLANAVRTPKRRKILSGISFQHRKKQQKENGCQRKKAHLSFLGFAGFIKDKFFAVSGLQNKFFAIKRKSFNFRQSRQIRLLGFHKRLRPHHHG